MTFPTAHTPVPPFLATQRLNNTAPLGSARFVPRDLDETMSAIFATWNVLDANMYSREPSATFMTGYLRELQLRRMVQLVRAPHVRTYCEVGMNGGHSLAAMMLARAGLRAHVFDLLKWRYSWPAATLINATFGAGRVAFYEGYSHRTLPSFVSAARQRGVTCDLVLVDGGHTFRAARADIEELQAVATHETRLVTDDIGMPPGNAIKVLNRTGVLRIEEIYGPFEKRSRHSPCMRPTPNANPGRMCPKWGFAVSRFLRPGANKTRVANTTRVKRGAGA